MAPVALLAVLLASLGLTHAQLGFENPAAYSANCSKALLDADFNSGTGLACGACLRRTQSLNMTATDSVNTTRAQLLLRDCCNVGCTELFATFVKISQASCADEISRGRIPIDRFNTMVKTMDTVCAALPAPLRVPKNPLCQPNRTLATEKGKREVCQLYGDPHLKVFGKDTIQTCNLTGTITLLTNDYLTISAVAEPVVLDTSSNRTFSGASVLKSITIYYKNVWCGNETTLTTRGTWRDTQLATGVAVRNFTTKAGQSMINVRVVTPWLGTGICVSGCPSGATVKSITTSSRRKLLVTRAEATTACSAQGLKGSALDACVFDAVSTGDTSTVVASASEVATELAAETAAVTAENRVFLLQNGAAAVTAAPLLLAVLSLLAAVMAM